MLSAVLQKWMSGRPRCPVYHDCGGCCYQDISYQKECRIKERQVQALLNADERVFDPLEPSPKVYHYRHRLDLKMIKRKDGQSFMGFSPKGNYPYGVVDIEQCPIAMKPVSRSLKKVKQQAAAKMGDKYRRANLVVRTSDQGKVQWGGIGKGSLKRTPDEYLWTSIDGRRIYFGMETFFQANLSILPRVFSYLKQLPLWGEDVCFYDLYGGVGLFSVGLAGQYGEAVLVEEHKSSIACARFNKERNTLTRLSIFEGRLEDVWTRVQYTDQKRHVVMIDPPRAGLTSEALAMIRQEKRFDDMLYLSCSPPALKRDLDQLCRANQWVIQKIKPFDFFPRTKHVETLVWLKRGSV